MVGDFCQIILSEFMDSGFLLVSGNLLFSESRSCIAGEGGNSNLKAYLWD